MNIYLALKLWSCQALPGTDFFGREDHGEAHATEAQDVGQIWSDLARTELTYTQDVKNRARRLLLEHAIDSLTKKRSRATVVRRDMLKRVVRYAQGYLVKSGFASDEIGDIEGIMAQYLSYDAENLGRKKPSELRVLYLAGPEPLNDLNVLTSLGCRPQNIWAIERDDDLFAAAVSQLKANGAFVRIHHGNLQSFFEQFGGQFDLVYFDGCGPIPGGKPNTLTTILALLRHERLTDFAALVTNFAEFPREKSDAYVRLMSSFFAPRYNSVPQCLFSSGYDPAWGTSERARFHVNRHASAVYSEFVTQFVTDLARTIVPWTRIGATPSVMSKFFAANPEEKDWKERIESRSLGSDPRTYPLLSFLEELSDDKTLRQLVEPLYQFQIHGRKLLESYRPVALLERAYDSNLDLASTEMLRAYRAGWLDSDTRYFCDIPMPNLVFSTLAGVYGRPMFVNPERAFRLSYKAKDTQMYSDVFVFDRCRSFFDSVPTIDLWPSFFRSVARQLVFRGCIDQIGWHDSWSEAAPFQYTALGGIGEHSAAYDRCFPDRLDLSP